LALAFIISVANLAMTGLYAAGTDLLPRSRPLQLLQWAMFGGLWLSLAEVWVHASGAASWHSWPLMWIAPVAAALQAPFKVVEELPAWKSAPLVLGIALVFALPALLMVPAGKQPL
jgi:hypothetical protein